MIEASCHCGAIRIAIDVAAGPEAVTDCNCSSCRRKGGLWAYYSPTLVRVTGDASAIYMWGEKSLRLHHCSVCFCVTHWRSVDPSYDRMGVNARNLPPELLARARVRKFDGADTWKFLDE
jgi:hypothetical protein